VSEAGNPIAFSPDGVIVRNQGGQPTKYPVGGGAPTVVAGANRGDQPLAWSADGRSIWVLDRSAAQARIFRVDVPTARRVHWYDVPYADPASIETDSLRLVMSEDGKRFVYGDQKHLSELYVVEGMR
jgi:hypothetical protein